MVVKFQDLVHLENLTNNKKDLVVSLKRLTFDYYCEVQDAIEVRLLQIEA